MTPYQHLEQFPSRRHYISDCNPQSPSRFSGSNLEI